MKLSRLKPDNNSNVAQIVNMFPFDGTHMFTTNAGINVAALLLKDGTISFIYKIIKVGYEEYEEEERYQIASAFNNYIKLLPDYTTIQITADFINKKGGETKKDRSGISDDLLNMLSEEESKMLSNLIYLDCETYMTISFNPYRVSVGDMNNDFYKKNNHLNKRVKLTITDSVLATLDNLVRNTNIFLQRIGVSPHILSEKEILERLFKELNLTTKSREFDDTISPRSLIQYDHLYDRKYNNYTIGNNFVNMLTITELPECTSCFITDGNTNIRDRKIYPFYDNIFYNTAGTRSLGDYGKADNNNHKVVISITKSNVDKEARRLKNSSAKLLSLFIISYIFKTIRYKAENLEKYIKEVEIKIREGLISPCYIAMNIIVYNEDKNTAFNVATKYSDLLNTMYGSRTISLISKNDIAYNFMTTLTGCGCLNSNTMFSSSEIGADITNLLNYNKKDDAHGSLFFNRKNQPYYFDLRSSSLTSPNYSVCGTTGGGKTFLICTMLVKMAMDGCCFFIIDYLDSYSTLVSLMGGEVNKLSIGNPVPINVLQLNKTDIIYDKNHLIKNKLQDIYYEIQYVNGSKECSAYIPLLKLYGAKKFILETMRSEQVKTLPKPLGLIVQEAVINILSKSVKNNCSYRLSDVYDVLSKRANSKYVLDRVPDFKTYLFNMEASLKDSIFSAFFNRLSNESQTNDKYIYYDLQGVKEDPIINKLATIVILNKTQEFLLKHRDNFKIINIDEAKIVMDKDPETKEYVEILFRTVRKLGGCVGVVSQNAEDFNTDALRTLIPTRIILNGVNTTSASNIFEISSKYKTMMQDLTMKKGDYSEAFLHQKFASGGQNNMIIRCMVDKMLYWMMTTNPSDKIKRNTAIRDYERKGFSGEDAIMKAIKELSKSKEIQ